MSLLDVILESISSELTEYGYSSVPTTNESLLNLVSALNKPDIISHDLVDIYNVTAERRGLIIPIRFQAMDDLQPHVNNLLEFIPSVLSSYPYMKCFIFVSGIHSENPAHEDMIRLIWKGLVAKLKIRYKSKRISWDLNCAPTQEGPMLNVLITYPDDGTPVDWDYIAQELRAQEEKELLTMLGNFELKLD